MEILRFHNFIYEAETEGKLGFFENARKQLEKMKGRIANQINLADSFDADYMKDFESLLEEIEKALEDFKGYNSSKRREVAAGLLDKEAKLMDKISKESKSNTEKIVANIEETGEELDKNLKASFAEVVLALSEYQEVRSKYNEEISSKMEKDKATPKFEPIKTGQKDTEKDGNIRKLQVQLMGKNKSIESFLKAKGAPNGVYGKRTTTVVKAIQKSLGLNPDGILTPEIYAKIMENRSESKELMMFEGFINEAKDKIDWEEVAKEVSGYKEETTPSPKVDKIKVDERLKLLGDFKDQSVSDNLVKVLEMGGLVTKTDKGNPAVGFKGITLYKNGRFFDKNKGKKGSFDGSGLKYDDGKSLTWEEFGKELEKSKVDVSKIEGLVRRFIRAIFGGTEDEDEIMEVFKKIKTKNEFNKFEEIWDSLKFGEDEFISDTWKEMKFDNIRKRNASVKDPVSLSRTINKYLNSGEIARLNQYLPDGVDKF
jgi:peptidoglycan hydrolase-like protein with peptidoglycan-binding domain